MDANSSKGEILRVSASQTVITTGALILPLSSSWWFPGSSGHAPLISRFRTAAPGFLRWPRRGRTGRNSAPWSGGPARRRGPAGSHRSWRSRQRPGPGSSSVLWSSRGASSPAAASALCRGQRSGTAHRLEPSRELPGKKSISESRLRRIYILIILRKNTNFDVDNKGLLLWLVLQREVEGPHSALLLLPERLIHGWRGRLAGEAAGRWREVTAVRSAGLSEPSVRGGQLQVRWAPHRLLLVVVKRLGGEVSIQVPFFQIQVEGRPGVTWAQRQFAAASRAHQRGGVAVSVNVSLPRIAGRRSSRGGELLLPAEALRVDVDPFEHVDELVGRRLLGFATFALATDPRERWGGEDEAEDAHHGNPGGNCHCGGGRGRGINKTSRHFHRERRTNATGTERNYCSF